MTATTKPPLRESPPPVRRLRFSSMETLGFSDATSIWSDTPMATPAPPQPRGRHLAPPPEPDPLAEWQPQEFGSQLNRGNLRWGLLIGIFLLAAGATAFGLWLYQRPNAQTLASAQLLVTHAEQLSEALPDLESFNATLLAGGPEPAATDLFAVDGAARDLFDAAGDVPASPSRSAAAAAAGSALDGVRLAGDAHSYRMAVLPTLVPPALQTVPALIELDEAARNFGEWQLRFDNVRSALPSGTLPHVTEQLDVLSGDLTTILGDYVDALREDDEAATEQVLAVLGERLGEVATTLSVAVEEIQVRVSTRITEARAALDSLLNR